MVWVPPTASDGMMISEGRLVADWKWRVSQPLVMLLTPGVPSSIQFIESKWLRSLAAMPQAVTTDEPAVLVELVERRGARVQAEARPAERAERQRGAGSGERNAQVGPRLLVELPVVRGAAGRDDEVQPVLAAAQKEHDEDLVVRAAAAASGAALGEGERVEARSGEARDGGGAADQKSAARRRTHG